MNANSSNPLLFTRLKIAAVALIGILFLEPCTLPRGLAQQDEKDKVIEQLKETIASQKRAIDDFDKRLRDSQTTIQAELKIRANDIKLLIENQKRQADAMKQALDARLRDVDETAKRIRELQAKLLASLEETKRAKLEAINAEERAKSLQARNDSLLEQVRELTRKIVAAEVKDKSNPPKREPENPNPPTAIVNGKIAKIVGELVQLDIGSDHGLAKNQTLDVYRLKPEAKYLGVIRIAEVTATSAIGRIVPSTGKARDPMLKVGDLVRSKLTRDSK